MGKLSPICTCEKQWGTDQLWRKQIICKLKVDVHILPCVFFTFNWLTLIPEMHFFEVSPWYSFLFTLQRQKKSMQPGDEAMMKIHKKLFIGIPLNVTFSSYLQKLQGVWRWNFRFAIRKIRAFTSGWAPWN